MFANAFGLESARGSDDAPETLKAKLRDDADGFFARHEDNVVQLQPKPRSAPQWNWGWATAAALALVLLATNVINLGTATSIEAARDELLADTAGTTLLPWAQPENPEYAQVRGDVVWNDERQEGYMLLTGMPVNDPATSQYQ